MRRATSEPGALMPKTPHSSRGPSRSSNTREAEDSGAPGENCPYGRPSGVDFSRTDRRGSADDPIRLREAPVVTSSSHAPPRPPRARHGRHERARPRSGPRSRAARRRRSLRSSTSRGTRFWFTTKSGSVYTRQPDGSFARKLGPTGLALNDIEFQAGGNVGLAVGAGGQVFRSADAGATWSANLGATVPVSRKDTTFADCTAQQPLGDVYSVALRRHRACMAVRRGLPARPLLRHGRHGRRRRDLGRRELAGRRQRDPQLRGRLQGAPALRRWPLGRLLRSVQSRRGLHRLGVVRDRVPDHGQPRRTGAGADRRGRQRRLTAAPARRRPGEPGPDVVRRP